MSSYAKITEIDLKARTFRCADGLSGLVTRMWARGGVETKRPEIASVVWLEDPDNPRNWCMLFLRNYHGKLVKP